MEIKNLVPSLWNRGSMPSRREEGHPFFSLQREMNRIFDDFFQGWDVAPFAGPSARLAAFHPSIDVKESDKEISVKAELPGLEEKDVEVLLDNETLTIKGEKKEEKEDKGKGYYHVECSYGSFHRVIPLPAGIDQKKVQAQFKNGVLNITLPKAEEAKAKGKKIPIKSE
ncbi:MAG: Spore protein SP21 [Syntrophaceae bacterium PtaB.Bin095]|nr:MAG: Spore protein SP21 [Syntrophaceae bacterium PtaB.Bin095]